MGPTGKFLKPQGEYAEDEFEEAFGTQAKGLSDGKVDFILIETQYDLKEALCALRAARKNASCPVFVTMTFETYPRGFFTMMGNSVSQCIKSLEGENVPVIGANCTLDSKDMAELIKSMRASTSLPLIAQANAGKATLSSDSIKAGDVLTITLDRRILVYRVLLLGERRGPAVEARLLYEDLSPDTAPPGETGTVNG